MRAMRALCVVFLVCAACAKKPAPKTPTPPPPATDKDAPPDAKETNVPRTAPASPAAPKGDPCEGGENK
jgi:hypothetical protein